MIFCTQHILHFLRKVLISSMDLQVGSHLFCSSSLKEKNSKSPFTIQNPPDCNVLSQQLSADTILVERGESFGVTEPSSLAIARSGDSDGTGGGGRLEALKIGDRGA